MDAIAIRCQSCQHAMKFSADKAGKKAKCPKCGTIAVIQMAAPAPAPPPAPKPVAEVDPDMPTLAPMPEAVQEAADANKKETANLWDDGGPATYEAKVDEELLARQKQVAEEEEAKAKQKKPKKKLPKVGRKVKALPDAEAWKKVRVGLLFISIACWVWLASHLLQGSYVLLGSADFSEYATMVDRYLAHRGGEKDFPEPGRFWNIDELGLYLEMIAGKDLASYARFALTLATILYFLQALLWAGGYGFCFPVPRRAGMFGQVIAMAGLAGVNILLIFIFKLLPVLGAHGYILIPYVVPEITLTEYNVERSVPIHVLYSGMPFWENVLTLLVRGIQYLEPTMGCIFLWSAGVTIKSTEVEQMAKKLTSWSLMTLFVLLCFHILSLAGASGVLIWVLRLIYALWFGFLLLFILRYAMALLKVRAILDEKINPRFELAE